MTVECNLLAYINTKKQNIYATFKFYDTVGKPYRFKEVIQGKSHRLFIFWASWCSSFRQGIPELDTYGYGNFNSENYNKYSH